MDLFSGRFCVTTASLWVQGLCGAPDAPHAVNVSLSSTGGSGVGSLKAPPVDNGHFQKEELRSSEDAVLLTFSYRLAQNTDVQWEAVLWQDKLHVQLPPVMPEGSRQAFVALLEFAEEQLSCQHVIVFFTKDRPDRASLVRTFMFLGLVMLSPGHPLVPPNSSENHLYMAYSVE
ncbi:ornithine decarboxylase antizyme 1-like [Ornithodoros turicata]